MPTGRVRFCPPVSNGFGQPVYVVTSRGTPDERWCAFYDRLEIGRDLPDTTERPGMLLVPDATVSRSHCVLTRSVDGRCFIRDTSRNGTRVDGRRLVPNVEEELHPGQRLSIGEHCELAVMFKESSDDGLSDSQIGTVVVPARAVVTVLVGDIRDYTVLVRQAPSADVQQSVSRVFRILGDTVAGEGGTIKEFQGDALMAFWEGTFAGDQAAAACRAALRVDALTQRLAGDPSVWAVRTFPLQIDWALASGPVTIDSFGGNRPAGLSMIGEAPILAFRLEKFASDETGRILACAATRAMASGVFQFRDLGLMTAKGFDRPDHVFALEHTPAEVST